MIYIIRFYKGLHIKEIRVDAETKEKAREALTNIEPNHGDIVQIKPLQ